MYILGIICLVFFAILGAAAFIGALVKAHLKCDTDGFVLLVPHVSEDNAEVRIRSASMAAESMRGCRIVCICGENDPARKICEKMQRQFSQLEIAEDLNVL